MRRSLLILLPIIALGAGACLHGVKAGAHTPQKRQAALARMTKMVDEDDVTYALKAGLDYGLDRRELTAFAQDIFGTLIHDGMCIRASELAKVFSLGTRYGETAVECVRKASAIEAATVVCDADVGDDYRKALIAEAWDSLETIPPTDRFTALDTLIESSCPLPQERAASWFPRTLMDPANLRLGRVILDKAAAGTWDWDLQAMFRQLLAAAIGFDAGQEASEIINDEAFKPEDSDYAAYVAYQIKGLRCEEAAGLAIARGLSQAIVESIFSDPKCSGTSFEGLLWVIKDADAQRWLDLSMKYGKLRLARKLADKLKAPAAAIDKVETATLDAGDFDAAMDFPDHLGESKSQHQDRVLQGALDRNDEWFPVRWSMYSYAQHQIDAIRRDGWIERSYLHALFRKDWKMAADCIAQHSVAATASAGARMAFEEALRAEDADTALDLARTYKLDDDCRKRAALLKARKIQEAERAKAKAAKRKGRRRASDDWNP